MKLDYNCEVDNVLDLEFMRGPLPKPTDTVMIDKTQPAKHSNSGPTSPTVAVNAEFLQTLMSMGFSENACRKALKVHNDVNGALDWIMEHMSDPNLDLPEQPSATGCKESCVSIDAASLSMLMDSGFTEAKLVVFHVF